MTRQPHDKLFKRIFTNPKYAEEELTELLSPPLAAAIDWSTLKREPGSYVDEALADTHSDLVFSARAGREDVLVFVLFEHQSTNDDWMALRLLSYMVKLWTGFAEDPNNGRRLPLIVPVVLSHAPGGWTPHRHFSALFGENGVALAPECIPDFTYAVDDLTRLTDAELKARPASDAVKLTLWVLRDARTGTTFLEAAPDWLALLERAAQEPELDQVAVAVITYLLVVLDEEIMNEFRVMLANEAPMAEGLTMTYGEKLLAQGHERGRTEGKIEGELEGKAMSLLLVLEARALPVSDEQRARILGCRDSDVLARWLAAAVTAESVDAALR